MNHLFHSASPMQSPPSLLIPYTSLTMGRPCRYSSSASNFYCGISFLVGVWKNTRPGIYWLTSCLHSREGIDSYWCIRTMTFVHQSGSGREACLVWDSFFFPLCTNRHCSQTHTHISRHGLKRCHGLPDYKRMGL